LNSKLNENDNWTEVITPQRGWFEINFTEFYHYQDLLWLLVKRDFTTNYKQTILGPFWYILQPLITTLIFSLVFSTIARIPTDNIPSIIFYMGGVVSWSYFSSCLNKTSSTFVSNAHIFGKVYFPRLIIPVSVVISSLSSFFIQFIIFIAFEIWYVVKGVPLHIQVNLLWLFPFLILCEASLGMGLGIIVSALTIKYRDLQFLIGFGIQLLMYATPVIYPMSAIPVAYRQFAYANPLAPLVETFRYVFLGAGTFSWHPLLYSFCFSFIVLFVGIILFNKNERTFMDTV
jgi:lipopolysaccharide transport system permease protein